MCLRDIPREHHGLGRTQPSFSLLPVLPETTLSATLRSAHEMEANVMPKR